MLAQHHRTHFFNRSSVVEGVLLKAHESGTRFTVIVIDSGPLFEGGYTLCYILFLIVDCRKAITCFFG